MDAAGFGNILMIRITFKRPDGSEKQIVAAPQASLMEAARTHGIEEILADCGGSCSCATCHVYIDPDWQERVGAPNENEDVTLDFAGSRALESRLACQIQLVPALDGLVVTLPQPAY